VTKKRTKSQNNAQAPPRRNPQKKEQKVMVHPTAPNRLTKLTFSLLACLTLAFALSGAAAAAGGAPGWPQAKPAAKMVEGSQEWYGAPENKDALEAKLKECGPAVFLAGRLYKEEDFDAWNKLSEDCKNAANAKGALDGRTVPRWPGAHKGDKKQKQ
jgi:hypothetical protein